MADRKTVIEDIEAPSEKPPAAFQKWFPNRERRKYWARRLASFGIWQIASQATQLFTGLLLVRWMTVEAYAQYGLVVGFQNVASQLVDVGFSGSIIALVGARANDPAVVGRYVNAARAQRNIVLVACFPLFAAAFWWFTRAHQWQVSTSIWLFGSIMAFVYFQGWVGCYS